MSESSPLEDRSPALTNLHDTHKQRSQYPLAEDRSITVQAVESIRNFSDDDVLEASTIVPTDPGPKYVPEEDPRPAKSSADRDRAHLIHAIDAAKVANRYAHWECGFGTEPSTEIPKVAPTTKAEFLTAIEAELATIDFLQLGLSRYIEVLHSGEHHDFEPEFLTSQEKSSSIAQSQLKQIKEDFIEMVGKMEHKEICANEDEIDEELWKVFEDAKPWIERVKTVLVNSHMFYKINYA